MNSQSTRHLVAPELLPGLEFFPSIDFSQGIEAVRTGGLSAGRDMPPIPEPLLAVDCQERFVPGFAGNPDVRVLCYTPPGEAPAPRGAVLHIHGGGYVIGTADMNDISNRAMSLALGIVVVSVDYRLAPECVWPGALNDCYAALVWLHDNAGELGVDPARIAIAGESAGGGHAAALAIHARDNGGPAICLQLLDAPMLDDRTGTTSDPHPHTGEFVWTPDKNRFGWGALLGVEPGGPAVRDEMVPARTADLSGLPPTFISVGSLDLFLEEDMEFTRRLTRSGVPAELHVIPGAYHGFGVAGMSPQLAQLTELRHNALKCALGL
ncbi:MAG: alpha/beta hydrolase [Novosphingobium sp.]|nr:alpha/beta hydrolase [Novosphingobium sp.]